MIFKALPSLSSVAYVFIKVSPNHRGSDHPLSLSRLKTIKKPQPCLTVGVYVPITYFCHS